MTSIRGWYHQAEEYLCRIRCAIQKLSNQNSHSRKGVIMRVPFRQQATNYDCAPSSIINALKYLFDRKDIPPFVVQRIYKDCLDIESFRGTSSGAMHDISYWLNAYREQSFKQFIVRTRFITGKQVHLRTNSKIIRCIEEKGAALLCVHASRRSWHYIICIRTDGEWLYCYDPAPHSKRFKIPDTVVFIEACGQEPNLKIRCNWLDRMLHEAANHDECKYIFGNNEQRECLLLNRIHE